MDGLQPRAEGVDAGILGAHLVDDEAEVLFFDVAKWRWRKKPEFQNGTLVSGNMDQNLRFAPPV